MPKIHWSKIRVVNKDWGKSLLNGKSAVYWKLVYYADNRKGFPRGEWLQWLPYV